MSAPIQVLWLIFPALTALQVLPCHRKGSSFYIFIDETLGLPTTSQRLCEVAASLMFLRGSNVQFRTKLSAGLLPPSRKTARYRQCISLFHILNFLSLVLNFLKRNSRQIHRRKSDLLNLSYAFGGRIIIIAENILSVQYIL